MSKQWEARREVRGLAFEKSFEKFRVDVEEMKPW